MLTFWLELKDENGNIGVSQLSSKFQSVYNDEIDCDLNLEFEISDDTWEVNEFFI